MCFGQTWCQDRPTSNTHGPMTFLLLNTHHHHNNLHSFPSLPHIHRPMRLNHHQSWPLWRQGSQRRRGRWHPSYWPACSRRTCLCRGGSLPPIPVPMWWWSSQKSKTTTLRSTLSLFRALDFRQSSINKGSWWHRCQLVLGTRFMVLTNCREYGLKDWS